MAEQEKEILEEEILEETMEAAEEAEETAEAVEEVAEEIDSEEVPEGEEPKTWAEKRAAKKQKKEEANADKEKIAELEDRVKRQLAEFENYRNRTEKEKQAMFETGAKSVLEKLLPIIDNFERGFSTVDEADKEDAFVQGMQKVYKQMMDELEKIGVKPIEAVGQEFNPNFHNAVMQVESDEFESGIVAQDLMKGYMYRDSVLRHSMVGVVS
ncbi:MAG: nucleotide exchange factor GrpE [Lachnospiraceae bacterium]|nr:nucleotide exchange factor GrpE [Lachnospiraceae bacterium]